LYFEYTCSAPKHRLSDDSGDEEAEGVEIEIAVEEGKAESCSDRRQGVDENNSEIEKDEAGASERQHDSGSNNNSDVDEAKAGRKKAEGAVAK